MYLRRKAQTNTSKGRGLTNGKCTTVLSREALLALVTWTGHYEQAVKDSSSPRNHSTSVEQATSHPKKPPCSQTGRVGTTPISDESVRGGTER